jgi:hypothetical protein
MICELQRGMQLHSRHVTTYAIAIPALVRMSFCSRVAGLAFYVVVGVIGPARIFMRLVAGRAGELPARKTTAFHQA